MREALRQVATTPPGVCLLKRRQFGLMHEVVCSGTNQLDSGSRLRNRSLTSMLAEAFGCSIVGVEPSKAMLSIARSRGEPK